MFVAGKPENSSRSLSHTYYRLAQTFLRTVNLSVSFDCCALIISLLLIQSSFNLYTCIYPHSQCKVSPHDLLVIFKKKILLN
jgi:hypothetical protein